MAQITMWDKDGKEHKVHPVDVASWKETKGWSTQEPGSSSKKPASKSTEKKV